MRLSSFRAIFSAAAVGVFCSSARAGTVPGIQFYDGNPLYVQGVIGTGSSTAYQVIDMASGTEVAWQYDFNGSPDGWQMLSDIAAADPYLIVNATYYPSFAEHLITNFQYGAVAGTPNKWDFDTGTYNASNVSVTNPQGMTWTTGINVGIDDITVSPGEIIGWVDQTRPTPLPVLPEVAAAVPEPASVVMLVMAGGLLVQRRRRTCGI